MYGKRKKRKPGFLFWDKSYTNAFEGGEEPKEAFSGINEHFQLYFHKAWGVRIIAVSNKCQNTVSKKSTTLTSHMYIRKQDLKLRCFLFQNKTQCNLKACFGV